MWYVVGVRACRALQGFGIPRKGCVVGEGGVPLRYDVP